MQPSSTERETERDRERRNKKERAGREWGICGEGMGGFSKKGPCLLVGKLPGKFGNKVLGGSFLVASGPGSEQKSEGLRTSQCKLEEP